MADHMHYLSALDDALIDPVLTGWKQQFPKMGICALVPESGAGSVKQLQTACQRHHIPLIGGIFPALLKDAGFVNSGVWLLCFSEMPHYALHENLPTENNAAEKVIEQIAKDIRSQIDHTPDVTLFMLFDAMVPNIATLLDRLYLKLANRVHYAGANAGSETFQPMPCLFDSQRIVSNGALLILLKHHRGAILEHGYKAPERTVYATSTQGNCISQIDWRPAFEVYQELVRAQYQIEVTRENFYQHAVHFPFGILRANHHVVVRIPVALQDDGSLFCVGEVPANSMLTLLEAPSVDTQETMRVLLDGMTALNGSPAGTELLLFYCAGRRLHLGIEQASAELREFYTRTAAQQVAGALSLGEIGSSTVGGYPLFQNATLVASKWALL